ncbi:MAG TPA: nucleotidyltransferase domain-containing protein [Stellaceae bacterium]|nr:nucleotidyltransferase domain-containing protein [Stellaceae bacterium]
MLSALAADPILKRLRAALDKLCGERIERVVVFGSRARGDAGEDSDYDVAVFLKDFREGELGDRWRELDRLAGLRSEILSNTGGLHRRQTVLGRCVPHPGRADELDSTGRRRSVTPETGELLDKGRDCLNRGRQPTPYQEDQALHS